MSVINVLMKPVSGMCNMKCEYCFYCDEMQKRTQENYGVMSENTLKNIIRKTMLNAKKMVAYAYQGGEPTLRGIEFYKKAVQFQEKYNKNGIQVTNALQTNGYMIDKQWCEFFAEHNFLIGVSIDGVKETHDLYRRSKEGKETYERIVKSIETMERYGVEYNILTVVNGNVAQNIKKIYQDYKQRGWNYQQYIACLEPLNEMRGEKSYALLPEQYGKFLIELFELWYKDWKRGKQPYIRQFENYVGILLGYSPESCEQRGICAVQNVVEADGSVYPCDFYVLDEYKIGNFNENKLGEIYQKQEAQEFIEESLKLESECRKCQYYQLCRGGCQRQRECVFEEGYYRNYYCKGFQLFFASCYERLWEIAKYEKKD